MIRTVLAFALGVPLIMLAILMAFKLLIIPAALAFWALQEVVRMGGGSLGVLAFYGVILGGFAGFGYWYERQ